MDSANAARSAATSGRSRCAAWRLFFSRDPPERHHALHGRASHLAPGLAREAAGHLGVRHRDVFGQAGVEECAVVVYQNGRWTFGFRRLGRNRPGGPVERAQALHGADADAEARGGLGSGERAARIEDALA